MNSAIVWWCPICRDAFAEARWMDSARPVPYHLLGRSMHSVQPLGDTVAEMPLCRSTVVRDRGRLCTIEPEL